MNKTNISLLHFLYIQRFHPQQEKISWFYNDPIKLILFAVFITEQSFVLRTYPSLGAEIRK